MYYLPMYKEEPEITEETGKIQIIREKPQAITGTDQVEILQTDKREYHVDGVFILRTASQQNNWFRAWRSKMVM